jgi:hypothetical protein
MAEVVQIAQEANPRSLIENRHWDGALILGPAIVAPLNDVQITNSSFNAPPEALFVEVEEHRPIVGFVGLRNVSFNDCVFQNVGIAGTREAIETFRAVMDQAAVQGQASFSVSSRTPSEADSSAASPPPTAEGAPSAAGSAAPPPAPSD